MHNTIEKLTQLRKLMQRQKIDYYYIPGTDPHQNEYIPDAWKRRTWISNFTGSNGDVLVGLDEAYLWTDPRYLLQADQELDLNHFRVMHQAQGMAATIDQWLMTNAQKKHIGLDPSLISTHTAKQWQQALSSVGGELIPIKNNLIDQLWTNQPALPTKPISILSDQLTGKNAEEKIADIKNIMRQKQIDAHIITTLDSIAWLLNIRGQDIEYNPLVISYVIITLDKTELFIDLGKLSAEHQTYFKQLNVNVLPYHEFITTLSKLRGHIWLDPANVAFDITQQLTHCSLFFNASPITLMKACKNNVEIAGMHEGHRLDGIALCRFFCWLEHHWQGQTELSTATQLQHYRMQHPQCRGLSFETIGGFGQHGAIIHYHATAETNANVSDNNLYLIDSGGHYQNATTDITRTIHLGTPTASQKKYYTAVLKGHLALRHAIFPRGTCGEQLDALARAPLWQLGCDYGHGTGHGVGCFLCVHEGPQRINKVPTHVALQPGMVVSNEPGVYFEGQYGIRIENLCVVTEYMSAKQSATQQPFYQLQDLTLVPYARRLIDKTILSIQEIDWINAYHQLIFDQLSSDLSDKERSWLAQATAAL